MGAQTPVPTFSRDIAVIFFEHCTPCHRPGQISPMSLLTYKDARPWSRSIRARVNGRTMPPWFADEGHRPLADDRRLNDNERMTILAWVDGGAPEGDPADLPPPPPDILDPWRIGTPDVVVSLPYDVMVPSRGQLDVQRFEVRTDLQQESWVQAIEIRPTDPAHVHQVIVYVRQPGAAVELDSEEADVIRDVPLAIYASGTDPLRFPAGTAQRLPSGAVLVFEVHYTTNGNEGRDRTALALKLADRPPLREVRTVALRQTSLTIPPGAASAQVQVSVTFEEPVGVISVVPHAHRRGRSFRYRLRYPDRREETILSIARFNWLWELTYRFAEPVELPAGTTLEVTATYDNSSANKANPDPRSDVRWGWDPIANEMMLSFITIATHKEH